MKYIILFCFFATYFFSQAQEELTQTIRGTILDKQTQSTLPGVVVQLLNADKSIVTTTNEEGKFRLDHIPLGRKQLKISLLSYKEKFVTIVLTSGKETVLNIELEENAVQGQEVVITAEVDKTKSNNKMATVSSRIFSTEEANRYAGSRGDPARMAANFAGVSGSNDSRNDIIIRGNSPLGVLWRLNGLDIPNPNHFGSMGSSGGPISILNNNTLDNSDFMSGAFPADYGNATAGVFDLKMRSGNNEKHEFLGMVGFNGFELGAEGPFSKKKKNASFMVNYRYSTLSIFKALGIDYGAGSAVPQYQDVTFKVDLPSKKCGKFSIWGVGGLSYAELLQSQQSKNNNLFGFSARDSYFRSNVGATGISHTYLLNSSSYLKTNVGLSGQYNYIKVDRVDTSQHPVFTRPEYRNTSYTTRFSANITYNKKFNAKNFVNAGAYLDAFSTSFADSIDTYGTGFVQLRNYAGNSSLVRLFAQWKHHFSEKFYVNTGFSYQYFTLNNTQAPEPRLGLRYEFNKKQSLSFGTGLHSQIQPLYVYFSRSNFGNGMTQETNRNLDFTKALHAVIAYDVNIFSSVRIKTEVYYQYLYHIPVRLRKDYFSTANLGADFTSPNVDSLQSKGTGQNYGIELTLEKFYSKGYYFLATGSFFNSQYKGSDGVLRNTAFNSNYVMNLLAGKEFKIKEKHIFAVDMKLTYTGGKRYVPIDLPNSIATNSEVLNPLNAYNPQYDPYFRIDVKPSYKLNTKKFTHEVSVDIQNVTKHNNIFQQQYDLNTQSIKTDYQLKFFVIPQYRLTF